MTTTAKTPTIPTTDAEAIAFALEHLEAFEVASFLRDWQRGEDLQPWLDAWHQDYLAA